MNDQTEQEQWRPLYAPAISERLLSAEDCAGIVSAAEERGFSASGVIGGENRTGHYDPTVRNCETVMLFPNTHEKLYDLISEAFRQVNQKQYRFELTGLEPIQILRYKEGSFFREHTDLGYQYDASANRKITLIAQLSDPASYQGGELVLFGDKPISTTQGTLAIFPSWIQHRVEPLTAGTRYTLVSWALGPPFN